MERLDSMSFLGLTIISKASRIPFCFDRCITKQALANELTREQEQCLSIRLLIQVHAPTSIRKRRKCSVADLIHSYFWNYTTHFKL